MSKLDDLIKQYCSNGIKYKELGTLEDEGYLKLGRGAVISKEDLRKYQGEYPVYSSSAVGNGALGCYGKYMFDDERISWSIDGGGRFFYRPKHKYSITNVCGWCQVVKTTELSTKYLYYYLTNEWTKKTFDYTKKAHPSVIRKEYVVAIPSLSVQEEIVGILDNFTELERELEKELEKRKKQYEYYKDKLLTPDNMNGDIEWKPLREICDFYNGKGHEKDIVECGKYIVINSKFISTNGIVKKYSNTQICPLYKDDIVMVMSDLPNGKALAKCFVVDTDNTYTLNQRIGRFIVKKQDLIKVRYLNYVLNRNKQLLRYDNGADQTNLKKDDILNIIIPIPSLAEQERIVGILDKFDVLISNISTEIDGREKQYEYYRNKLLTFPQAV